MSSKVEIRWECNSLCICGCWWRGVNFACPKCGRRHVDHFVSMEFMRVVPKFQLFDPTTWNATPWRPTGRTRLNDGSIFERNIFKEMS